tara:strand:- start:526 stop:735 length:210 start_codon:yes stop_codon:yes gene_type:complete
METSRYARCKKCRRNIDLYLEAAARLYMYIDHTPKAKKEAKLKEIELLNKIAKIDPGFAEKCGWLSPSS